MKKEDIKKVVLAYSGGLDTSIIIPWLKENYNNCEVIAVTADLGQGDELVPVHDKALKSGASKCYILDLKEEFIADYVWPTVKAGAVYEKKYLLGTSFARPLIAKKLVEIAENEGADAIAHGATGKGNDQVRFELSVKALAPDIAIIAPWREWSIRSRDEAIDFAAAHNIPVPVTHDHDYSMDRNMWHLSHEGSDLEDPWNAPKDELFIVTNIPEKAPDQKEYVELEFVEGVPVAVNGEKMSPATIVYEVQSHMAVKDGTPGGLFFGTSNVMPGQVGGEYFMTKGHYHARRECGEYYWCIQGTGALILMDESGKCWFEPMQPGSLHYIPGYIAHRLANTGDTPLRVGACWPSDAGHDYASIAEHGFTARLMNVGGVPTLVQEGQA